MLTARYDSKSVQWGAKQGIEARSEELEHQIYTEGKGGEGRGEGGYGD